MSPLYNFFPLCVQISPLTFISSSKINILASEPIDTAPKNFKNESNLQAYLRYIAGKDLKSELQDSDTETTIKFEKLFGSNIPNANQLKLNDVIYADTSNSGEREKFYLNKMTYDLIKEMPDELTLILETEV